MSNRGNGAEGGSPASMVRSGRPRWWDVTPARRGTSAGEARRRGGKRANGGRGFATHFRGAGYPVAAEGLLDDTASIRASEILRG